MQTYQQHIPNFKPSSLSHLSTDLGDSKGKVVRFFEDNVLVSSDSDLESPFEVIFEKYLLPDPFCELDFGNF